MRSAFKMHLKTESWRLCLLHYIKARNRRLQVSHTLHFYSAQSYHNTFVSS